MSTWSVSHQRFHWIVEPLPFGLCRRTSRLSSFPTSHQKQNCAPLYIFTALKSEDIFRRLRGMSGIVNIYLVFWIYIVKYTLLIQILEWIIRVILYRNGVTQCSWVRGHFNHDSVRTIYFVRHFYSVLLLYRIYKAMEWPSAWQPLDSTRRPTRTFNDASYLSSITVLKCQLISTSLNAV